MNKPSFGARQSAWATSKHAQCQQVAVCASRLTAVHGMSEPYAGALAWALRPSCYLFGFRFLDVEFHAARMPNLIAHAASGRHDNCCYCMLYWQPHGRRAGAVRLAAMVLDGW
mmetsp:Transcript_6953/g.21290  ORF Transcript_6953/g.21290 Transcript_6953/m.21290 type:complete len:113 (-) Transcript_6953:123-461(-)